tara:strand:+ start:1498 stop:1878 length:381 start_codon:yes stop_codon:yes gene_type:complete
MNKKEENTYKTIGEVAKILNLINTNTGKLNTHTIRFWEKQFKQIKPKIFSGRRRYYDNKSIQMLKKIKYLLKDHGMTIDGVKRHLDNTGHLKLDEFKNAFINAQGSNLKNKLTKISKLIKEIKKIS